MKNRFYIIVGICLIVCAHPQSVSAQSVSTHYTEPILNRIDIALIGTQNAPAPDNVMFIFFGWLDEVKDAFVGLIDIENRLMVSQRNLKEVTPCLQFDLLLLEAKMEEINQQLLLAQAEDRYGDILILADILRYAKTRYNHLISGATDPQYVDYEYWNKLSFDPDTWCCPHANKDNACVAADTQYCLSQQGLIFETWQQCNQVCSPPSPLPSEDTPICPFDSNYLPPTKDGYGCDAQALSEIIAQLPQAINDEKNALLLLENTLDPFWKTLEKIRDLDTRINNISSQPVNTNNYEERTHKRVTGCNLEPENQNTEYLNNPLPEGAARKELRGPFTVEKNHIALVVELEKLLREQGAEREQEISLVLPSAAQGNNQAQQEAVERENGLSGFTKLIREFLRGLFTKINTEQSGKNALPFAQSLDAQQKFALIFSSLREENKHFAQLSGEKDKGIRKFTANFAFFLRRTCLFRPCNSALDRILKIVLTDECFPYASGEFMDADLVNLCKESSQASEQL